MARIIFDFDGTIHDSMEIYAPAVRDCIRKLEQRGICKIESSDNKPDADSFKTAGGAIPAVWMPKDSQIRCFLGMEADEVWDALIPALSPEFRQEANQFIYARMRQMIRNGEARLYDGAIDVLQHLKMQGHQLVFLSQCSGRYMEENALAFYLKEYFDEMYCAEEFGWKEKTDIVRELMNAWEEDLFIAIGDKASDVAIANASERVKTIFCSYGFGSSEEGKGADAVALHIRDIPKCVDMIIHS